VLPAAGLNWQIDEQWRLVVEGPGAELSRDLGDGLRAGVGVAYESRRFRLDNDPIGRGSVIEDEGVPVFVRLSKDSSRRTSFSFELGAVMAQTLRVENRFGRAAREFDVDPALYAGLRLEFRF